MKNIELINIYDKKTTIKMILFVVFVESAHYIVKLFLPGTFLGNTLQRTFICNTIILIIAIFLFKSLYVYFLKKAKDNQGKNVVFVVCATLIAFAVNIGTSVIASVIIGTNNSVDPSDSVISSSYIVVSIVSTVLIAPIVEETIYRMCLFGCIYKENRYIAYAFSSLLFAFGHVSYMVIIEAQYIYLVQMLPYFVAGIMLAYIFERTGNIICPIFTHMTINFLATIASLT